MRIRSFCKFFRKPRLKDFTSVKNKPSTMFWELVQLWLLKASCYSVPSRKAKYCDEHVLPVGLSASLSPELHVQSSPHFTCCPQPWLDTCLVAPLYVVYNVPSALRKTLYFAHNGQKIGGAKTVYTELGAVRIWLREVYSNWPPRAAPDWVKSDSYDCLVVEK